MRVKKPLDGHFGRTTRPRQADIDQHVEQTHGAEEVPPRSSRAARAMPGDEIIYDLTETYDDDEGYLSDVPPATPSTLEAALRTASPRFFAANPDSLHDDDDHVRYSNQEIPEILRGPALY